MAVRCFFDGPIGKTRKRNPTWCQQRAFRFYILIYCKAIKKIQLPGVFFLSFLLQITTLIRKISWEIVRLSKRQVVYHLHFVNSMTGFHDSLAHVVRVLVAISEDAENSASMHHCFHKMFQHGHPRFSSCFSRYCPRTMSDMAYLDNYQAWNSRPVQDLRFQGFQNAWINSNRAVTEKRGIMVVYESKCIMLPPLPNYG